MGYAGADVLQAPFTRSHLADALGITTVHLSRTLQAPARPRARALGDDRLEILNRPELERLAAYERIEGARRPLI